jgi:hypothetical protein
MRRKTEPTLSISKTEFEGTKQSAM